MTFKEALKQYRLQLALMLLLLVALYWQVVPEMVMQWENDENYSHGFLVPFISGYFFWQRWPELRERLVGLTIDRFLQKLLGSEGASPACCTGRIYNVT